MTSTLLVSHSAGTLLLQPSFVCVTPKSNIEVIDGTIHSSIAGRCSLVEFSYTNSQLLNIAYEG